MSSLTFYHFVSHKTLISSCFVLFGSRMLCKSSCSAISQTLLAYGHDV